MRQNFNAGSSFLPDAGNADTGFYAIGMVANFIGVHPETLRVWEKNGLIFPKRQGRQRRYSNNDLKRLKFIKYMLEKKGLNVAGVKQLISMYACWYKKNCKGGAAKNSAVLINEAKPCWKLEATYCRVAGDRAETFNFCAAAVAWDCIRCNQCRE